MANDTLEQSKIDRTITEAQQKNTDLRNCVEEVIDTFAVRASEQNTELLYDIDEDGFISNGELFKVNFFFFFLNINFFIRS